MIDEWLEVYKGRKEVLSSLKMGRLLNIKILIVKHSKDAQRYIYDIEDKSHRIKEQKAQLQSSEDISKE